MRCRLTLFTSESIIKRDEVRSCNITPYFFSFLDLARVTSSSPRPLLDGYQRLCPRFNRSGAKKAI